jgi:hypothetical protein
VQGFTASAMFPREERNKNEMKRCNATELDVLIKSPPGSTEGLTVVGCLLTVDDQLDKPPNR